MGTMVMDCWQRSPDRGMHRRSSVSSRRNAGADSLRALSSTFLAVMCAFLCTSARCDERKVEGKQAGFDPVEALIQRNAALQAGRFDWPQWGGSSLRNNTPAGKNIPTDWDIGGYQHETGVTLRRTGHVPAGSRNIKWVVPLGSQTWGNPVVANGRIFVGTNNGARYVDRFEGDMGVVLCFAEDTGRFLWQHANHKLKTGRVNDWPMQGVCSTPVVDGDRLWYVSNRGEVVCLDTEGFHDGEDDGVASANQEIGKWVSIFRMPANLHADMPRLRQAFEAHGSPLPSRIRRYQHRSGRWTLGTTSWNRSKKVREIETHWELQLRSGILVALPPDTNDRKPRRKLFAEPDDLYPALENDQMDESLRRAIREHGLDVAQTTLTRVEDEATWQFTGILQGEQRLLQMTLSNGVLTFHKRLKAIERDEADVVWKFDMIRELAVFPHNMSNCSMITAGDMLFVCTSNGVDESHGTVPTPRAPSFIALNRNTGKLIWEDNSPFDRILHGQWASPSYGVFDGQPQVIFPGGDGWVYSFDPQGDGKGGARLLWKFDANPKEARWELGGRAARNSIIAFPVIYDGLVYLTVGQDPEHGEGPGHLWCIDPARKIDGSDVSSEIVVNSDGNRIAVEDREAPFRGLAKNERALPNPDSAVVWDYTGEDTDGNGEVDDQEKFHRSINMPVIKDDILYVADLTGFFHCLNARTGKSYWHYDTFASCWSSALVVDGHVYQGDEDGDVHIFRHSFDRNVAMMEAVDGDSDEGRVLIMDSCVYMTPIVANGVLYIATRNSLFAIEHDSK